MLDKNKAKLKRKQERETFVGFRPSVIDHGKIYTRKTKTQEALFCGVGQLVFLFFRL